MVRWRQDAMLHLTTPLTWRGDRTTATNRSTAPVYFFPALLAEILARARTLDPFRA